MNNTTTQTTGPLPRNPQPYPVLAGRYALAVARVWDLQEIKAGGARPGQAPECIFDTEDGLRLIISRERNPDGLVNLHMSMSAQEGALPALGITDRPALVHLAVNRLRWIRGSVPMGNVIIWVSQGAILHFIFEEKQKGGNHVGSHFIN